MNKATYTFLLGIVLTIIAFKLTPIAHKVFKTRTRSLKNYWTFVVVFGLCLAASYIWLLNFVDTSHQENAISILNNSSTLMFAGFVGYFAFQQVALSRKDKLDNEARGDLRSMRYSSAVKRWNEAFSIDPRDSSLFSNLLEAYLLNEDFEALNEKLPKLRKLCSESRPLTPLYLETTMHLLREHTKDARESIQKTISTVQLNPAHLKQHGWNYKDIKESEVYKKLKGENRRMLDNYIHYLSQEFESDDKIRFESGDYTLIKK